MKKSKHDLIAISQEITTRSVRDSDAPDDPPEMQWDVWYPIAIDRALTKQDYVMLLQMLSDNRPIHPLLLPSLADAIRARGHKKPGAAKRLTAHEEKWAVDRISEAMRGTKAVPGILPERKPVSQTKAIEEYIRQSDLRGRNISESTVKRAIVARKKK